MQQNTLHESFPISIVCTCALCVVRIVICEMKKPIIRQLVLGTPISIFEVFEFQGVLVSYQLLFSKPLHYSIAI